MNELRKLSESYTYREIAKQIKEATGRTYSVGHLGNVARGSKPFNGVLRLHLKEAYPELFLSVNSEVMQNL